MVGCAADSAGVCGGVTTATCVGCAGGRPWALITTVPSIACWGFAETAVLAVTGCCIGITGRCTCGACTFG